MSVEVEDHEEVENDALSDEDWEWPAEQNDNASLNSKILQMGYSADSNTRLSQVEHETLKNTKDSSSRLPLPPKKAKSQKLRKYERTILGPCPICNKDFRTKTHDALRKHLSNSHFRRTYTCQVCTHWERFPTEIAEHVMTHHPGTDCVKCKRCNQMINLGENPQTFEDHVRDCLSAIRIEKNRRHRVLAGPQVCKVCGKTLYDQKSLKNHLKGHVNERQHRCDHPGCEKTYIEIGAWKKHKFSHLRAEGLSARYDAQCDHCGKVLASANSLKSHITTIHENKSLKIKCKFCEEIFHSRSSKNRHINLVHFPQKYHCNVCAKSFSSAMELKIHNRKHKPPTLKCPHCNVMKRWEHTMEDHIRTHTGEKPYECCYCKDYSAKSSSLLNCHKKSRHPQEWADAKAQKLAKKAERDKET